MKYSYKYLPGGTASLAAAITLALSAPAIAAENI